MAYDFNGGLSTIALKKPIKPSKVQAPDPKNIFLHFGEAADQYQTFIEVVSDLAQAFKFLPKSNQMRYQYGNPLLLLSTNPSAVTEYVYAMLHDYPLTSPATSYSITYKYTDFNTYQQITTAGDFTPDQIRNQLNIYLSSSANMQDRNKAAGILQGFSECVFEHMSARQPDPNNPNNSWGWGAGVGYSNLNFSPNANDWDLLDGVGEADSSVLGDINTYFSSQDWDAIKNFGAGESYEEIAKSGVVGTVVFTGKMAFDLMCSMLESKERVFSAFTSIFGIASGLGIEADVEGNITRFLDGTTNPDGSITGGFGNVDPHNLGILKMFFGMETDFINNLDAFMNCTTFWGGDGTSNLLMDKVNNYIDSLQSSDPQKYNAASGLETLWLTDVQRWDKVGDTWARDITGIQLVTAAQDAVKTAQTAYDSCAQTVYDNAQAAYNIAQAAYDIAQAAYDEAAGTSNADLTAVADALNTAIDNLTAVIDALNTAYTSLALTNNAYTVYDEAHVAYDDAMAVYNDAYFAYVDAQAAYDEAYVADPSADLTAVTDALNTAEETLTDAINALNTAEGTLTTVTADRDTAIVDNPTNNASLSVQDQKLDDIQTALDALKDAKAVYADFEKNSTPSWVEFFCDRMDKCSADEVIRVIVGHMMNMSADKKYRNEKTEYQNKKEDLIMDEMYTLRMQAKAIAESRKTFKKLVARSAKVSTAIRAKAPAGAGRARLSAFRAVSRSAGSPAVRYAGRPAMRSASGTTPKHLAAGGAAKHAPSRIAGGQGIKRSAAVAPVRPKAASPALRPQAQTHAKDDKKVI